MVLQVQNIKLSLVGAAINTAVMNTTVVATNMAAGKVEKIDALQRTIASVHRQVNTNYATSHKGTAPGLILRLII